MALPNVQEEVVGSNAKGQCNKDKTSWIIKCPPEIYGALASSLLDPIDLMHFSLTCRSLHNVVDHKAWWVSFMTQYPKWSKGCHFDELADNVDGTSGWKRFVLRDKKVRKNVTVLESSNEQPYMRSRIPLDEAKEFKKFKLDVNTIQEGWQHIGSPTYYTDEHIKSTISASVLYNPAVAREKSLNNQKIHVYNHPDLANPIATLTSDAWTRRVVGWDFPHVNNELKRIQVIDIRHYPGMICNDEMRILIAIAFKNTIIRDGEEEESQVWLQVKVIEFWVPMNQSSVQPRLGRIQTIEPSQNQNLMSGRAAKFYTVKNGENLYEEHIALFGLDNSGFSRMLVVKRSLFKDNIIRSAGNLWSKIQHSLGVTCITLFPPYSEFERMVVLLNKSGRGMIYDWHNEEWIAELHLNLDRPTLYQPEERKSLYCWGVQVDKAIETSDKPSSFRIVALSDSEDATTPNKWEICWWNIDTTILELPKNLGGDPPILYSSVRQFNKETLGYCLPAMDGQPVKFISYLIWNHFLVGMTTQNGIIIIDMENSVDTNDNFELVTKEWVAFTEKDDNALLDIVTISNDLVFTTKDSQLVWSFHNN